MSLSLQSVLLASVSALTLACVPESGAESGESESGAESETLAETLSSAGATSESSTEATGESETDTGDETGPGCPPDCPPGPAEAGFIELAGVDYELGLGGEATDLSSTDARYFWALQPADQEPEDAPVFVLFNGGPGVSTGMLLGLSTGRASFAPARTGPDLAVVANPHSWTALGNLVWIDARQTGFSYGLLPDPGDADARSEAMSVASFNSYRDAADFVRVVLALLADHPELRDNPVVLVGESYGGTRAQLMLDMLLQPEAYADGSRHLRDPALAAAVLAHHEAVRGGHEGPASAAEQFGRQILIQPALTGTAQEFAAGDRYELPGSVIEQFAAELGVDYTSCAELGDPCDPYDNALDFVMAQGRSAYDYRAPATWLIELFDLVELRLGDASASEALLGVPPAAILGLAPGERVGAWRAADLGAFTPDATLGDWPEQLGELETWDRYFAVFHPEALGRFRGFTARSLEVDPADLHFGERFLTNLVWVETLVTDARYDLAIHTPAIADALAGYTGLVSAVTEDLDAREWIVEYQEDAPGEPGVRTVFVPRYEASHAVTLDQPAALREDVELWLGR